MAQNLAYKVLTSTEFESLKSGTFVGAPIDAKDGYIHLSTEAQLTETLDKHFAGQTGLIIATVNIVACGGALRWEISRNGELFPHLYGALTMKLVVANGPVRRGAAGVVLVPHPNRCAWADSDPLMRAYHDTEWGVPQRESRALWELLMLEGFQAGLAWITVLRKREAFRKAFANFDPQNVAGFGEPDIARLLADPGIIRARAKIEATIAGAVIYLRMAANGENFADYCWSFTNGKIIAGDGVTRLAQTPLSELISKDLKRRGFKFVGPTIVYAWLQAAGMVNDHDAGCFCRDRHPMGNASGNMLTA